MRKVLSSSNEVCHFWANEVQPAGKAGNMFFENAKIYSYGQHFCIARKLHEVTIFTTRRYSNSTGKHVCKARQATHGKIVFCNDPSDSAFVNRESAINAINSEFIKSEKAGIRKTTTEKHKGAALRLAIEFNSYLEALPITERTAKPINTAKLDQFRAIMQKEERKKLKEREELIKKRALDELDYLAAWRTDNTIFAHGMFNLPAALRLNGDIIETSRGANIPVSDALKLWPIIQRCKNGNKEYTPGMPIGNYRLTQIKSSGDIVVGCHNISYAEIELMSIILGVA